MHDRLGFWITGWRAFSSSIFNALRWEFPLVTTFPSDGKGNAHIINSFDICTWTFRDMISVFASTEWWLERWLEVLNAKSFPPLQFWHPHLDLLRHTPQCLIPLNDDSYRQILAFSFAALSLRFCLMLIFRFALYRINRLRHTAFDSSEWWLRSADDIS